MTHAARLGRVSAGCLLAAFSIAMGAVPASAGTDPHVARLITTSEEARMGPGAFRLGDAGPWGRQPGADGDASAPAYIVVAPPEGGRPVRLNVAPEFRRRLASLADDRGELITISISSREEVTAATRFDGPKELASPDTFIFQGLGVKSIAGQDRSTLKLSRFGPPFEALVPLRPGDKGRPAQPDVQILQDAMTLKEGDVVQVEFAPGVRPGGKDLPTLAYLAPLHAARTGAFVKLASGKDEEGRPISTIVIELEGKPQACALPAAVVGATIPPRIAAVNALARRLKAGHIVTFTALRAEAGLPVIRDLRYSGTVEPTGEKALRVRCPGARVELSEWRFGRNDEVTVNYAEEPGDSDDRSLARGISRVLASDAQIERLKLTPDQVKSLTKAADALDRRRAERPSGDERAWWAAGYRTWFSADNATRQRAEQEMLFAAQELSLRWRKDDESALSSIRSTLNAEQIKSVQEIGREERPQGPPWGPNAPNLPWRR